LLVTSADAVIGKGSFMVMEEVLEQSFSSVTVIETTPPEAPVKVNPDGPGTVTAPVPFTSATIV
jgi:hypothetical protein